MPLGGGTGAGGGVGGERRRGGVGAGGRAGAGLGAVGAAPAGVDCCGPSVAEVAPVSGASVVPGVAVDGWSAGGAAWPAGAVLSSTSVEDAVAFGAAFLRGVVAAPPPASMLSRAAASKATFLSALGSATCMGGGAGRPLKRCQSPVTLRMAATGSVGCAPTPSQ